MKDPKRLFAGVAALALAGSAAVVAVRVRNDDAGPGSNAIAAQASPGATPSTTPGQLSSAQEAARKKAIDVLLARRTAAVLKGDLKGFLAAVDPKQAVLVARQRMLFTNLRKFGFSSLKYS